MTNKISQLYGDSATFDYSPYQGKVDFAFIDGSHSYDYVVSDTRNVLKIMNHHKGAILCHDFSEDVWEGNVVQALLDMSVEFTCLKQLCRIAETSLAFLRLS